MENKMVSRFQMNGLSAPKSFTCSNIGKEDIFWATTSMPDEVYNELFKWATNDDTFWDNPWQVDVQHEGLFEDGTPINPIVVCVIEQSTLKVYLNH